MVRRTPGARTRWRRVRHGPDGTDDRSRARAARAQRLLFDECVRAAHLDDRRPAVDAAREKRQRALVVAHRRRGRYRPREQAHAARLHRCARTRNRCDTDAASAGHALVRDRLRGGGVGGAAKPALATDEWLAVARVLSERAGVQECLNTAAAFNRRADPVHEPDRGADLGRGPAGAHWRPLARLCASWAGSPS